MRRVMISVLLSLLLTGCAVENQLKNLQLIYATSLDINDNNDIVATVTIQSPGGKERNVPEHEIISATGATLQEALNNKIGQQIAGTVGTSKNQVLLISEKLAKQDLAKILDSAVRISDDPMLAKVAIVRGDSSDLIRLKRVGSATAGEYLRKIIQSARHDTVIPAITLHNLFPLLHDSGRDAVLPVLKKEGDKAIVDGMGLLHKRKFTGYTLTSKQSTLALLLNGSMGNACVITRRVKTDDNDSPADYMGLSIMNLKRKKQVWLDESGHVQVRFALKMKGSIIEYAGSSDQAGEYDTKELAKRFSEILMEDAQGIFQQLLKSHSDAYGIARDIMAYYPEAWAKMDWETEYPKTNFQAQIAVEIVSKGIIN
ncbi:Ger(x)C family spore germination protein [Paenibacillus whitsoniae]|uniref:Ger(X)C family spore germination protein n=1 Tax=Paenibacillus whitsoniae TaxID=2496558 RepID=A0A3S0CV27_9BACL|nr:Ger(x)C family spore germination protein [Paenibacillus whitsoniae]RTE09417.1 Ger(x)C family spore germination protein [Paenibacillus whitsoniae]